MIYEVQKPEDVTFATQYGGSASSFKGRTFSVR